MSQTKLECPECGKVLRPARPVEPGKKVRCPKCQAVFIAPEEGEEVGVAAKPDGGGKKKPAAKAKAEPAKKAAAKPGEEEEGAYGVIKEDGEEDKPTISYAPDSTIKDLRGPAVAMLTSPTNLMIRSGFIGVFGCVVLLLLLGIPALMPVREDDRPESRQPLPMMKIGRGFGDANPNQQGGGGLFPPVGGGGGGNEKKAEPLDKLQEPPPAAYKVYFYDWGSLCDLHWAIFLVAMIPIVLLGCYSATISMGGIKAQNLESRGWGMAASIMAMLPLNTFCPNMALAILFQAAVYMILEVSDSLAVFLVGVWFALSHLLYPLSLGSGIWTLVTLKKEEVIAGFEYEGE